MRHLSRRAVLLALCAGLPSCSNAASPSQFTDPAFTFSVLNLGDVRMISPIGAMAIGYHIMPLRHSTWYLVDYTTAHDVFAPGPGTVDTVDHHGDDRVVVRQAEDFLWYIDHIKLTAGLDVGSKFTAGQKIGTTSTATASIDFGVINTRVTRNFVVPARYAVDQLHAEHPILHYAEPLKSQLLALDPGLPDPLGRNDYDIDGTLQGNWFLTGTPVSTDDLTTPYWGNYLAFVVDPFVQAQPIASLGTAVSIGLADPLNNPTGEGQYGVKSGPAFSSVTPASGLVVYRIQPFFEPGGFSGGGPYTVIVQMTDGRHLRVEAFLDQRADPAFDGNSKTYER